MVLKEIYSAMGISVDNTDKQNTQASSSSGLYSGGESNSMNSSASFVSTQEQSSPIASFPLEVNASPLIPAPSYPSRNQIPEEFTSAGMGMDPTAPILENKNLGPPPMTGFVKKSKS